jgi:hypothetical protein
VLPVGADAGVGGEPTTADVGVGAGTTVAIGWIGGAVVVHRLVLRRSTTRWSRHNLPFLNFLVGADCIVCDHDVADEL